MVKERIIETDEGIQDSLTVEDFNVFQRSMRDRGWIETSGIIRRGIQKGRGLEVGSGPGYLGLEWLMKTEGTRLTALEISREMIKQSSGNAKEYGLTDRVEYVHGNAMTMPFKDDCFEGAFSNGSLHEWENPLHVFNEIHRVLKRGGLFFISDMRRDSNFLVNSLMKSTIKGRRMKKGFATSHDAAYTRCEIEEILNKSRFHHFEVKYNLFGMDITGMK